MVIVGGGLAAWTVARELRQRNATIPIHVVCACRGDFYPKPMLSNALAQRKEPDQLVQRSAAQQSQVLRVTVDAGARVVAIDRAHKLVRTDSAQIPYARLVLALGADPIRLSTPGIEHALSVNDLDDYRAFRALLAAAGAGARVAILGGGLIGSEFANDLAASGYQVTVIDPAPWLIGGLIPEERGQALKAALEGLGVHVHVGDLAERVERTPDGKFHLALRSGAAIEADLVLSAVGLRPRTALASAAGLAVGRGILVDEMGRTSDPDIYALGDCAAYASAARPDIAGGAPRALPYVLPIMAAGKAIAATLAGQPTPIRFGDMPVRVKTPALPLTISG